MKTDKEELNTVYRCRRERKPTHCESTERKAIAWLEANGGGTYHNILHEFKMKVPAK